MRMQQVMLSIILSAFCVSVIVAGTDTEFSYQGRLLDAGQPANGTFNVDVGLWDDPTAGNQVGPTNAFTSLPILDGLFTVELDFGGAAFDNNDRWLEITVDGVPLVPRQPITRTPYSIQTRGIFVDQGGRVGIGTNAPLFELDVQSNSTAIHGQANSTTGTSFGVFGRSLSEENGSSGVYGASSATSGLTYGGLFENSSSDGRGIYSLATATTGLTYAVYGVSNSTNGIGVYGEAKTSGVRGLSISSSGRGVSGLAAATTGTTYGVYGESRSSSGHGILGEATAVEGTTYGGRFISLSASGFAGFFEGSGNDAVYIENTDDGRGLRAVAPADTAVWAQTTTGFAGVHGQNASTTGLAVYGQATATTGTNYGVYGASASASGYDFYAGGAGVNYGASSSRRWKHNVVPISDPLVKLAKLQGVYFDWDEEHGGAHDVGMIAEEVGAVLPEVVQFEENGIDASGMDYSKMTPLLVEAVNALRAEKDRETTSLRAEITSLRAENSELRAEKDSEIRAIRVEKGAEIVARQNRLDSLELMVAQLASTAEEPHK